MIHSINQSRVEFHNPNLQSLTSFNKWNIFEFMLPSVFKGALPRPAAVNSVWQSIKRAFHHLIYWKLLKVKEM